MIRPLRRSRRVRPHEHGLPYRTEPDGREVCLETTAGKREYVSRMHKMLDRQGNICPMCHLEISIYSPCMMRPVFGHECSRGGGKRDDRLLHEDGETWRNACLCWKDNDRQGSRRYHWIAGNTRYVPIGITEARKDRQER